jgi:hypothetical protein
MEISKGTIAKAPRIPISRTINVTFLETVITVVVPRRRSTRFPLHEIALTSKGVCSRKPAAASIDVAYLVLASSPISPSAWRPTGAAGTAVHRCRRHLCGDGSN